jgi:hypothetical protein
MGKRDDLIARYADDLRTNCGMHPKLEERNKLLRKVRERLLRPLNDIR